MECGVPREELFITTKVWIDHYGYEECKASVEESLRKLKTDYLDLCLLHQPFSDYYGAYRALEELYAEGKIKAIGVKMEAWAPFGEGRNNLFTNETLVSIGKKYNKSSAQVMLRWLVQRGVIVACKSTHIERMQENINVFDFELTEEDMNSIKTLDTSNSLFFSHNDPNMVEWFDKIVKERRVNEDCRKENKKW